MRSSIIHTNQTSPPEPKIRLEPGNMVWLLKSDSVLEARDHRINAVGDVVPIPADAVGKMKGQVYLVEPILRPVSIPELIISAKTYIERSRAHAQAQAQAAGAARPDADGHGQAEHGPAADGGNGEEASQEA